MFGGEKFVPLSSTQQGKKKIVIDGKPCTIFDSPDEDNSSRICNQGSAFPDDGNGNGITGTCGCCACATIINKAGGNTSEKQVIMYATQNSLCSNRRDVSPSNRGGTSSSQRCEILRGAGIDAHEENDTSIYDLAEKVESGYGVIIAVGAQTYNEDWYGPYLPGNADGHALVLESVIRDGLTGKIEGFYVIDSNGHSTKECCVRVTARILEEAFRRRGRELGLKQGSAVVTSQIIW